MFEIPIIDWSGDKPKKGMQYHFVQYLSFNKKEDLGDETMILKAQRNDLHSLMDTHEPNQSNNRKRMIDSKSLKDLSYQTL